MSFEQLQSCLYIFFNQNCLCFKDVDMNDKNCELEEEPPHSDEEVDCVLCNYLLYD